MPPASATSGVPSPLKSEMVGGPPPWGRPHEPLGHSVGERLPFKSIGARTTVNFCGCAAPQRHTDTPWFMLSTTATSGLPSLSKSATAGQPAFQSEVPGNELVLATPVSTNSLPVASNAWLAVTTSSLPSPSTSLTTGGPTGGTL